MLGCWSHTYHSIFCWLILVNSVNKLRILCESICSFNPANITVLSSKRYSIAWLRCCDWLWHPLSVLLLWNAFTLHKLNLGNVGGRAHDRVLFILFLYPELLSLSLPFLLLHVFEILLAVLVSDMILVEYLPTKFFGLEQLLQDN